LHRRDFLKTGAAAALPAPGHPPIWDLHCHLMGFAGSTPEEQADQMLRFADRMNVERMILSHPGQADPTPEELRADNDLMLRAIRRSPDRIMSLVYVNPNHVEASLREIDRCLRDGPMVGLKLWIARHCDTPELDPLVARATELDAIVFQHTYLKNKGNLPGESTPMELAALARRHPRAKIILGHTGADWERGLRAVRGLAHVTVDLAGSDPTAGFVEMAVREVGERRVLYGSDVGGRSFASQLAKVMGADVPQSAKEAALGGNLRRLLEPLMRKKGMRI